MAIKRIDDFTETDIARIWMMCIICKENHYQIGTSSRKEVDRVEEKIKDHVEKYGSKYIERTTNIEKS